MPDEAAQHADAIVLYGAEGVWPRLVARRRGRDDCSRATKAFARGCSTIRITSCRDSICWPAGPYNRVTVQTSRGCPLNCEFCAASIRITSSYQQKPVDKAIREIQAALGVRRQPFIEFADDNTFVNKKWGKALSARIAPLGIRWFTETDISIADDDELLDLLADSGCRQVLIGLESPDAERPRRHRSAQLEAAARAAAISRRSTGSSRAAITVNGCFILGLDNHTPGDLRDRARFRGRSPGCSKCRSPCRRRFRARRSTPPRAAKAACSQDRYWDRCTLFDVNYRPKHMTRRRARERPALALRPDLQRARVHPPEAAVHGDRQGAARASLMTSGVVSRSHGNSRFRCCFGNSSFPFYPKRLPRSFRSRARTAAS